VYSFNVPVPNAVSRLAADLHPRLVAFDRLRDHHTLVCKRFETDDRHRLRERLRNVLDPTPAFAARVTGIDCFADPVRGPGPVVYLAVESPGLRDLHRRLVDAFGAVADLEGPDYTPHVTLARGGSVDAARDLASLDIDPVSWTVSELALWSRERRAPTWSVSLPY
jgi:2'-5' RNA ligase